MSKPPEITKEDLPPQAAPDKYPGIGLGPWRVERELWDGKWWRTAIRSRDGSCFCAVYPREELDDDGLPNYKAEAVLRRAAYAHNQMIKKPLYNCSFCHRQRSQATFLVMADPVCICDRCIETSRAICIDNSPNRIEPVDEKGPKEARAEGAGE